MAFKFVPKFQAHLTPGISHARSQLKPMQRDIELRLWQRHKRIMSEQMPDFEKT
jgi:hypothetical protein